MLPEFKASSKRENNVCNLEREGEREDMLEQHTHNTDEMTIMAELETSK